MSGNEPIVFLNEELAELREVWGENLFEREDFLKILCEMRTPAGKRLERLMHSGASITMELKGRTRPAEVDITINPMD